MHKVNLENFPKGGLPHTFENSPIKLYYIINMPTLFKGKAKAKFVLEPSIKLLENKGFKDQEISLAKSLVEENKSIIIAHWKNAGNFKKG
ncbi:MAG: DUF4160 domain-containing protein [Fibromonadaceae bacterium]|nr:DUF4160 domain-containing protein [Fibromonadaceae bacterium]